MLRLVTTGMVSYPSLLSFFFTGMEDEYRPEGVDAAQLPLVGPGAVFKCVSI